MRVLPPPGRRTSLPRSIALLVVAIGGVSIAGASIGCAPIGVVDPDPLVAASSPERTDSAILDALRREGWTWEEASGNSRIVRTELPSGPVQVRIEVRGDQVRLRHLPGDASLAGSDPETVQRRKKVRRTLERLAERIEYFIESADLTAGPLPGDADEPDEVDDAAVDRDPTAPNADPRD